MGPSRRGAWTQRPGPAPAAVCPGLGPLGPLPVAQHPPGPTLGLTSPDLYIASDGKSHRLACPSPASEAHFDLGWVVGDGWEGESTSMLRAKAPQSPEGWSPSHPLWPGLTPPQACCCGCGVQEPLAGGSSPSDSSTLPGNRRRRDLPGGGGLPGRDLCSPSLCHCEMSPSPGWRALAQAGGANGAAP